MTSLTRKSNKILFNSIHYLENAPIPFANYIYTFLGSVALRMVLEFWSTHDKVFFSSLNWSIHFVSFFASLSISFIILFYFIMRIPVEKIARFVLPCCFIINIAPIVDLIASHGQGLAMGYLKPANMSDFIRSFFLFTGSHVECTPGMRAEAAMGLMAGYAYLRAKEQPLQKILIGLFGFCVVIYGHATYPYLTQEILNLLFPKINFTVGSITLQTLSIALFIEFFILFTFCHRDYFLTIIKGARWLWLWHFEALFILGFLFSEFSPLSLFPSKAKQGLIESGFDILVVMIVIALAWIFSEIIERISNENKSHADDLQSHSFSIILKMIFILVLWFAFPLGSSTMISIISFMGITYLYSLPPLQLKRIPVFSKWLISLNSFLLFCVGYSLQDPGVDLWKIPAPIIFFFMVPATLALNVVDLKDFLDSKQKGMRTLPDLIGIKASKIFIGLSWFSCYAYVGYLSSQPSIFAACALTGIAQFILINKQHYVERKVFAVYLTSLLFLGIYLLYYLL